MVSAITPIVVRAQPILGYDQLSLAGAAVARPAYSFTLWGNPAGILDFTEHRRYAQTIDVAAFRSFGLRELTETGVSYTGVRHNVGWAAEIHYFGFDLYREWSPMVGAAVRFDETVVGVSSGLFLSDIPGYGRAWVLHSGAGFRHRISKQLVLGGRFVGVPVWSGGDYRHALSGESSGGAAWRLQERVELMGVVFVRGGLSRGWAAATEVIPMPNAKPIDLRLAWGYRSDAQEWSGGFRMLTGSWHSALTFRIHPVLGWRTGVGFGLTW